MVTLFAKENHETIDITQDEPDITPQRDETEVFIPLHSAGVHALLTLPGLQ